MTRAEGIVLAFFGKGKAAQPPLLPDGIKPIVSSAQDFMRVGLMPHVEEKFILREIENVVKRDGNVYHTEVRRKMPAVFISDLFDPFPDLSGKDIQFVHP